MSEDGWIRHSKWARVSPVSPDTLVQFRVANGRATKPMLARNVNWDNPSRSHMSKIREYRVVKAARVTESRK